MVVRDALSVDPLSGQVYVDGAASDAIPHVLTGIPLHLRDLRVYADRPDFTLNPTSCERLADRGDPLGLSHRPLGPRRLDAPVSRPGALPGRGLRGPGLQPAPALRLKGGTRRGAFTRPARPLRPATRGRQLKAP